MKTHSLSKLSSTILKLHKALLDFQKDKVERASGRKLNPYEVLDAALNSPEFAWLKPLSQMAVEIDLAVETLEDKNTTALESANSPEFDSTKIKDFWLNPPESFHKLLIEAIQVNPDISFLFSEVRMKASDL